ncbi:MmcQ/YjbR family DNA-binding protein [Aeromonas caviae]|jgi:predicted DNA-binding protein (MmcQ/YjbR family)|uniref:MmcQ/YjbR family DNA-binding protein n=1 Tax=Aeromonas TaxID=642 RepID=UPI0005B312AB|nr:MULTISPECIES: MmcQ/YjbR family DNA-binding protein [Aeromonas]AUZ81201.1 DNA-binding protein [Aeromonas sp. ASNIH1]AXB02904.1 MmcQ/YjbR family DNA-binding protein [Aeromonas caviae]MCE9863768.1 MmcQ/YjbR family DNA-binding protein [Aeromonas caviae]MDH0317224.1 MmcQ/YjbR family DNA-binding protein [Aeromonas caviae]MDH1449645.1 MmcQ/YjbR family DNA-binding protein [Aeromonas caviae]
MTLVQLREFLLSQPGATEDTPFGPEILVYRIAGKMFALVDWQAEPLSINLKCEPELALLLREIHPEVKPGWHMNKQHWNTVTLSEGLSDDLWQGWVVHSYERVVAGLPRAKRPQAPRATIREG